MVQDLKAELIAEMKRVGAYDVGIADPHQGFGHAPEGRHPLTLMPECRSVVTFVVPRAAIPNCFFLGVRRAEPQAPDEWTKYLDTEDASMYIGYRVAFLFTAYVILKATTFLSEWGYRVMERCDKTRPGQPQLPEKLCAYEAGLGVYGRSGLILHPQLGNRIVIGAFLTDAVLETDVVLHGFDPCQGCNACIRACPAGAYGSDGSYHGVWSMDRCLSKRQELVELGHSLCDLCWKVCPAGKYDDRELFVMGMRGQNPLAQLATWVGSVQGRILCDVTPELA
jgi:ferredoxin